MYLVRNLMIIFFCYSIWISNSNSIAPIPSFSLKYISIFKCKKIIGLF